MASTRYDPVTRTGGIQVRTTSATPTTGTPATPASPTFKPGQGAVFTPDPTVGGYWTHTDASVPLFRDVPATPATPASGGNPATPATPAAPRPTTPAPSAPTTYRPPSVTVSRYSQAYGGLGGNRSVTMPAPRPSTSIFPVVQPQPAATTSSYAPAVPQPPQQPVLPIGTPTAMLSPMGTPVAAPRPTYSTTTYRNRLANTLDRMGK